MKTNPHTFLYSNKYDAYTTYLLTSLGITFVYIYKY